MSRSDSLSLISFGAIVWRHRSLLRQLIVREFNGRYRGSLLGVFWALFLPLCMLGVYTFVFAYIFRARWPIEVDSPIGYAPILFAGLIVHGVFAECASAAPHLILGHVTYVKKVIFPLEILPVIRVANALMHAGISFLVLLVFLGVAQGIVHWTIVYWPIVIAPYALINLGIVLFLSSVGVFLRDVSQLTGLIVMLSLFLTPIFYPISAVPDKFQLFMYMNPLTFAVEQTRAIAVFGQQPDWQGLAVYYAAGIAIAWLGFAWFQKTRKAFADVL